MIQISLKDKFLKFFENNIWIGSTVFIKALAQIGILKAVSVYFGASGVGYLGQVLSCITIVNSLFSVGLVNFLITELSKNKENKSATQDIYNLVGFWCSVFSVFLIVVAFIFSFQFSELAFGHSNEILFFRLLSVGFVLLNLTSITQGIFSSQKAVKTLFFYNLMAIGLGFLGFILVVQKNQSYIPYAALAFYFSQGIIGLLFLLKLDRNVFEIFKPRFNLPLLMRVFKFTLVMAITGALGALQQVYMRNFIIKDLNLTWVDVGHWQALLKISEINLSFIGLTMISLYLPSISETTQSLELRKVSHWYLKQVFLVVVVVCTLVGLAAPLVLRLIYSQEFAFLGPLLKIQLLGDIFKLCSWIFTYFILSKLKLSLFLSVEICSLILLTALGVFISRKFMIDGLVYAQAMTSFIMFIITFFIFNYFSKRDHLWNK
jgi:PST family polysaccharide transporter